MNRIIRTNLCGKFSGICRSYGSASGHGSATEYTTKWTTFFNESATDRFELCRGLNNAFAYDICPPVPVLEAALRACRRLNDFATSVRIFGAVKEKLPGQREYEEYVGYLRPLMDELGTCTPEELGREDN